MTDATNVFPVSSGFSKKNVPSETKISVGFVFTLSVHIPKVTPPATLLNTSLFSSLDS